MKGLDGLQGPIYVGTGCVFRRQALYGCDAPVEKKTSTMTCNCFPEWRFLCFRSRKNKRPMHTEAKKQIHSLETIEEREEEEENEGKHPCQGILVICFGVERIFRCIR